VGGLDGLDEKQSRKQANFVVRVKEGKFLASTSDTVFSFKFLNPPLDKAWFTDEMRVTAADAVPVSVEVAGAKDLSIVCLRQDCALPKVKRIAKAQFQVPGTGGLEFVNFQMQNQPVVASYAILTESSKVNAALNRLTLRFEIQEPLASGSRIQLQFTGLGPGFAAPPQRVCLSGSGGVAAQFSCQNCTRSDGSMAASRSWAVWGNNSLTLTAKPGASIAAGLHSLSFDLQNPSGRNRESCAASNPQQCPSRVQVHIHFIPPGNAGKVSEVFGNVLGAGNPPRMTGSVAESSAVQSSLNVITFEMTSNVDLPTGSSLTVRGLVAAPLDDVLNGSRGLLYCHSGGEPQLTPGAAGESPLLTLATGAGKCPCLRGAYGGDDGSSLIVDLLDADGCRALKAGALLTFAIVVRNPSRARPAAALTVEALYAGCKACGEACACVGTAVPAIQMRSSALEGRVLGAGTAWSIQGRISESNPVPGQKNLLTARLSSSVALLAGSRYLLTGFRGMLPPQADINYAGTLGLGVREAVAQWKARHYASGNSSVFPIPITREGGGEVPQVEGSLARFNMTEGTLELALNETLAAGEVLAFRLSLINRERPYDDDLVGLTATANVTLELTPQMAMTLEATTLVCAPTGGICPVAGDRGRVLTRPLQGSSQSLDGQPRFLHASVSESSKVLGSSVMLSFKLRVNFALRGGEARFVVSNLGQVSTASSDKCLLVKALDDLYPACVCTEAEGEVCDSCSAERLSYLSSLFLVWVPHLEHPDLGKDQPGSEPGSVVGSCSWNQEDGRFSIDLNQNLAAEDDFEFSFTVLNQKGQVQLCY